MKLKGTRKESALDRRLRDLERESEELRKNMKVVSRALKKGEDVPLVDPASPPEREHKRPAVHKVAEPEQKPSGDGDLFDWKKQRRKVQPPAPTPKPPETRTPKKSAPIDQRFASYLTTGSFTPVAQAREDRSVQRNKAIFMILVVLLVGFVIFKVVRYF